MLDVEEKLAKSLTAESTELLPHIPYLLQDLWELGSSPGDMLAMIRKHMLVSAKTRVLDLACGKGAVSVRLAEAFGCRVKGIDIMPAFIEFAAMKAREHGVEEICVFSVGDINDSVRVERGYDIVVLGSVGDVLGMPAETVEKLKATIRPGGYILLDDAYARRDDDACYHTRDQWLAAFNGSGVRLVDEIIADQGELAALNCEQQGHIARRAGELKERYPDQASLFDRYIESQQAECDELENEISCVTLLLQAV